jgi:hypothetical protein
MPDNKPGNSPDNKSGNKPSERFLERTKEVLNHKFRESKKIVDSKKEDWKRWERWYKSEIREREHLWESNLVIPKAYTIVSSITPSIVNTIFGMPDYLNFKNPRISDDILFDFSRWYSWFSLRKMMVFPRFIELFTSSPTVGTSFVKVYPHNNIPTMDFVKIYDFFPDPKCNRPGDIDSMSYCFHRFSRDLGQLERAKVLRVGTITDTYIDDLTGQTQRIERPYPYMDNLYFNLDQVWKKHVFREETEMAGTDIPVNIPSMNIVEYWGEIETTFGAYDYNMKRYAPGKYEEYVCTGVLGDKEGEIDTMIRCEPSTFYYEDRYENRRVYLKPFISSLYSILPGEFYGMGAIQPVESLIEEMKEHHDLYLDEHKRSVMSILQVLERSGLTKEDLEHSPRNIWYLRDHGDVKVVEFPEINLQAFQLIHNLIDKEIDRAASTPMALQGMPVSKRQTYREVQALIAEAEKKFSVFIRMSDQLTLRPFVMKTLILMRQMPQILQGEPFVMPDGTEVRITPEMLVEDYDITFAATGVEPDSSKFAKREVFPRLLKEIVNAAQISGQWTLNLPDVLRRIEGIYDMKDLDQIVQRLPIMPIEILEQALQAVPEELKPVVQQYLTSAMELMQLMDEQSSKKGGKKPAKSGLDGLGKGRK